MEDYYVFEFENVVQVIEDETYPRVCGGPRNLHIQAAIISGHDDRLNADGWIQGPAPQ